MKASANINDLVSEVLSKVPAFVFDNTATFYPIDGMLHTNPDLGNVFVEPFFKLAQLPVPWFFEGLDNKNVRRCIALVPGVLEKVGAVRENQQVLVRHLFIVHRPFVGRAQVNDVLVFSGQKIVLHLMAFFFTAEKTFLYRLVGRAVDVPFAAVLKATGLPQFIKDARNLVPLPCSFPLS